MSALTASDLVEQLSADTADEQSVEDSQNDESEQETISEAQDEADDSTESDDSDAQSEQPDKDSEIFIEWEQNGEKIRVTQKEMKEGYLRQSDYTQKTQNLARERQEAQTIVQQEFQSVQALASEYGQLTNIDQQLSQYQQVDWQGLRAADPLQYSIALADFNNLKAHRGEVAQQITGKQQYMAQLQAATLQEKKEQAMEWLQKTIPNYSPKVLKQMESAAVAAGYSMQELSTVADTRALNMLWKAAQWDALQSKKPEVENKVKQLPTKATKAAVQSVPVAKIEKQIAKLRDSGKQSDFAALLSSAKG